MMAPTSQRRSALHLKRSWRSKNDASRNNFLLYQSPSSEQILHLQAKLHERGEKWEQTFHDGKLKYIVYGMFYDGTSCSDARFDILKPGIDLTAPPSME